MGKYDLYLVVYGQIVEAGGYEKTIRYAKYFAHDGLAWTYIRQLEKENENIHIIWEGWIDG